MEVKKFETVLVSSTFYCDICKQDCKQSDYGPEYATLRAKWGYYSNKDLEDHRCDLCEACYDKVRDFIENTLKGKVSVYKETHPNFLFQDENGLHLKSQSDILIHHRKL